MSLKVKQKNNNKEITIDDMSIVTTYKYLIGMIEGCMEDDDCVVYTEKLLDALLEKLSVKIK